MPSCQYLYLGTEFVPSEVCKVYKVAPTALKVHKVREPLRGVIVNGTLSRPAATAAVKKAPAGSIDLIDFMDLMDFKD